MLKRSPKVAKMYLTYQKHFFRFIEKNKIQDFQDEDMLVELFNSMSITYAPSTLWVIYSCVNSWMIENKMSDLKHKPLLKKALKFKTDRWVAKKAEVFSPEDVHNVIMHYGDSKDHRDRLRAVTILLLYYGL